MKLIKVIYGFELFLEDRTVLWAISEMMEIANKVHIHTFSVVYLEFYTENSL